MSAIPVVIIDLDTMVRFIRSVAMMRALAESASMEWKTYDDSLFLNIVYGLLPWKEKPGYVDTQIASGKKLQERFAVHSEKFVDTWIQRAAESPSGMFNYLEHLAKLRQLDQSNLDSLFHEARAINQQVEQQLNQSIRTFAIIKLTATIAVAVLSAGGAIAAATGAVALPIGIGGGTIALGGSATAFGGLSTGFSITCSVIKEWNNVPQAKVIAVSKDVGKYVGGEILDKTADHMLKQAAASQSLHQKLLEKASRQIDHYSRMIAQTARDRVKRNATKKLAEKAVQKQTAQQGLKEAAQVSKIGQAVKTGSPILFAAWDIWDGITDYAETWEQTR
jgi:hypothetical protein